MHHDNTNFKHTDVNMTMFRFQDFQIIQLQSIMLGTDPIYSHITLPYNYASFFFKIIIIT